MKYFTGQKMVLLVAGTLFALVFTYMFQDWEAEKKAYLEGHVREMERSVHAILSGYEKTADLIFRTEVKTPGVEACLATAWETDQQSLRDAMRNTLHERLTPLYREMIRIGFRQFQFHFPDNTSFLRFHRPARYGDDLTDIRKTVARTNREKVKTVGFEEGRVLNGYRFVYPMIFRGRHVGSVETSISLLPVARELACITEGPDMPSATALLIRREQVMEKVWAEERGHYASSKLACRYLVDAEVTAISRLDRDSVCKSIRAEALPLMEEGQSFALHTAIPGKGSFIVEFLPKKDIDGEIVGYLVHLQQDTGLDTLRRFFELRVLSLFLLGLGILFFTYYRQRSIVSLQALATTDPLTGVLNRRALLDSLEQRLCLVRRYSRSYSLIMFDVDHFKDLNDGFGHALGDRVLQEIVEICREELRAGDLLARWGGDEFVILLAECDAECGRIAAERIRKSVYERFAGEKYVVSLSLGVCPIPVGACGSDSLFAKADAALYRAKEKGRDRVEVVGTEEIPEA